jgi:hypothetical protein
MDAPQLGSNDYARGEIITRIDDRGACVVVDGVGKLVSEQERLQKYIS